LSRSGGFQGIGFAIPVDLAKSVLEDLVKDGKVSRGWLGVSIQDVDPALAKAMNLGSIRGALINEVFDGSPAQKGGLRAGDVVVSLKGQPITDANALRHQVAMLRPGEKAEFEVLRDSRKIKLQVTVSRRDEGNLAGADANSGSEGLANELGLEVSPLSDQERLAAKLDKSAGGVVVRSLQKGKPAARAGLREGDILLQLNQKSITDLAALKSILASAKKDAPLLFLIRRGNGQYFAVVER